MPSVETGTRPSPPSPSTVAKKPNGWTPVIRQSTSSPTRSDEIGGDIAVDRVALGLHRPPLELRDELAGHLHRLGLGVGEAAARPSP